MNEVEDEVQRDSRALLEEALDAFLTPEQLRALIDDVLQIRKKAWVSCPHCKKKNEVEIPDAKSVVGAMSDLMVQAKGRPDGKQVESGLVVNRSVYVVEDKDA